MVDPKLAMIAAALALSAAPALAQDDPRACDRCERPQSDAPPAAYAEPASRFQSERRVYVTRSETVTRASYSEGYLSWPGKDSGGGAPGFEPQYGPQSMQCPPVRPGERVISCRYVPIAQQADIAPMGGVLYADGGVGPEYIASGGGGGGGTTIIEGGASASASSSASASAAASANVSVLIEERQKHKPKGGGYTPPPPSGGGYWPPGSMTPPSGGSWAPGSMSGGGSMASNDRYGSWPSGGMASGSGGVGVGHGVSHTVVRGGSHGHGRR